LAVVALYAEDFDSGGDRFFGTFVTDYLDLNGGPTYLMDITDPDEKGNPTFEPPQLEFFKRSFIEVESKIEGMIRALKSIKR